MSKIRLTKEEALEAADTGTFIKSIPWKWGTIDQYTFERDNSKYLIEIHCHSSEGWQIEDGVNAMKVQPIIKTVVEWEEIE